MIKLTNEMRIGILVTSVLAALLALTIRVGNFQFLKKGYEVKASFYRIEGLGKSAPVLLNGLEVGAVQNIRIVYDEHETKMELVLWLSNDAKLREGAKASVKNKGFLGDKYVELTAGNKDGAFLSSGAVIEGQEPVDFDQLVLKGNEIADQLKELSENLNERLEVNSESIDRIVFHVDEATEHLSSITKNVDERLTLNKQSIDDIVSNLRVTSENLEEMSHDLKENPWKLLYKERAKKKN